MISFRIPTFSIPTVCLALLLVYPDVRKKASARA